MQTYRLTRPALSDVEQIEAYLVRNASEDTATRTESRLFAAFAELARTKSLGHRRLDVSQPGLLFYLVDPYLVAFRRSADETVLIIRVLHGRRNLPAILP